MQCVEPVRITKNLDPSVYPEGLLVPCGRCISCRIAKRREWSVRMLHELDSHDDAVFITLTYDDDHIPANASLCKADLQKFFKRLRRRLDVVGRKIRYFACGEYGDETHRPHYHAIIFGLSIKPEDKEVVESSWTFGLIHFGLAEPDSIRYVAQYVDKKFTGDLARVEYFDKGREPVFRLLSLGLGRDYVDRNKDQITSAKALYVNGVVQSLPRYYIDRLDLPREYLQDRAVEADRDVTEHYIGLSITDDEAYRQCKPADYRRLNDGKIAARDQFKRNLEAKVALKKSKL